MKKPKPCAVCNKMTTEFLFKDKMLGIPICSKKCEHQYIENLTPNDRTQMDIIRCIDKKIATNKKHNRIGWYISGFGALLIGGSLIIANAILFIAGNTVVVLGTLSTRHFQDKVDKLMKLRKRIAI
ncbi:MAG: hypothetical protein QXH87_01495 [Candidatus Bathyarchaeia archaeon]